MRRTKRCTAAVERFAIDPGCRPPVIADVRHEKMMIKKTIGGLLSAIAGCVFILALLMVPAIAELLPVVNSSFDGFRLVAIPVMLLLSCLLVWRLNPWDGRAVILSCVRFTCSRFRHWVNSRTNKQKLLGSVIAVILVVGCVAFHAGRIYQQSISIDNSLLINSTTLRMLECGHTNKATEILETTLISTLDWHDAFSKNPFRLYRLGSPISGRHWEYELNWARNRVKQKRDDWHYILQHPKEAMERFASAMTQAMHKDGQSNLTFRAESGHLTLHGLGSTPTIRHEPKTNVESGRRELTQ